MTANIAQISKNQLSFLEDSRKANEKMQAALLESLNTSNQVLSAMLKVVMSSNSGSTAGANAIYYPYNTNSSMPPGVQPAFPTHVPPTTVKPIPSYQRPYLEDLDRDEDLNYAELQ